MRCSPIAAIAKFADIFPKVLAADVNVRAADRTLQLRPMPLNAVRVMNAVNPLVNAVVVYDLMEPLRPVVDCEILQFARTHTFTPEDFTINQWGGCRLNPQMAKVVASQMSGFKVDPEIRRFLGSL
jgi:hypothetical protein